MKKVIIAKAGNRVKHLTRAGLLLAAAVIAFVLLRAAILQGVFTLDDFALRPPNREADQRGWMSLPAVYADSSSCAGADCHGDIYQAWATSAHGTVACENCHGPAQAHVEDATTKVMSDTSPQLCETCHAQLAARPSAFPQIEPTQHYPESACPSCHLPHRPGPAATITHAPEGDCLQCHSATNARPAKPVPINHTGRTNDQCLLCHEGVKQ